MRIIKVIVSFFRKGEEVAIERHRSRVPVDKDKHAGSWLNVAKEGPYGWTITQCAGGKGG